MVIASGEETYGGHQRDPEASSSVVVSLYFLERTGVLIMQHTLRQRMDEQATRIQAYFDHETPFRRFQVGTQNETRLNRALVMRKLPHLINRTLLTPSVHEDHTERMFKRLRRMCRGVNESRIRFVTILDSLALMDSDRCLKAVHQFRQRLVETTAGIRHLHLIGTIECEVVSLERMRQVTDTSQTEQRKLDVLESMCRRQIKKRDWNAPCLFLIHFHGVMVTNYNALPNWSGICQKVWRHDARQVRIQELSESFAGKSRDLPTNLRFIARYITKGGNDFIAGKSYLRYKIGFENTDVPSEEEWVARNWRRSQVLKVERIEDGLDDVFGLSVGEICQLALVIDGMMSGHPQRTGYVVDIKTPKRRQNNILNRSRKACSPVMTDIAAPTRHTLTPFFGRSPAVGVRTQTSSRHDPNGDTVVLDSVHPWPATSGGVISDS